MNDSDMLRLAVKQGNTFLVENILQRDKVNIRNTDRNGLSSLFYAALNNDIAMAEYLLKRGHESDQISRDCDGNTIPIICAMKGSLNVLDAYLQKYPESLQLHNKKYENCFMTACKHGKMDIVRFILKFNPDLDTTDIYGNTALHHAFAWGFKDIVNILLDYGADYSIKNNEKYLPIDYSYSFELKQCIQKKLQSSIESLEKTDSIISL